MLTDVLTDVVTCGGMQGGMIDMSVDVAVLERNILVIARSERLRIVRRRTGRR